MDQIDWLKEKFERIGARLVAEVQTDPRRRPGKHGFLIDVKNDRKGEYFHLLLSHDPGEFQVVDYRPRDRHLLLMVKPSAEAPTTLQELHAKFLCGHDERHWFVAGVNSRARHVEDAKQALKPELVLAAEAERGLKLRQRHRRRNEAFVRQGEWFFVPAPEIQPDVIYHNEPLRRGRGKSHVAEDAFRYGGTLVYVCKRYPNGLTQAEYVELTKAKPEAAKYIWRTFLRDSTLYVRGGVRHPDHATAVLNGWHRVVPNAEVWYNIAGESPMAFLD